MSRQKQSDIAQRSNSNVFSCHLNMESDVWPQQAVPHTNGSDAELTVADCDMAGQWYVEH